MDGQGEICFIGYGKLSKLAKTLISRAEFANDRILLLDTTVDGLHRSIDQAVKQGCEVFIAGSANAAEFRRYSGAMLIEIKLRAIDYAIAIRKALKLGMHPVVASYRYSTVIRPEEIAFLFDEPIEYIEYQTSEELSEKLQKSSADAVIGASHVSEAAEQLGRMSIFVYPGEETVLDALRRARAVSAMLQKEQRNTRFIRAIIAESKTGIVGFSEKREVLLINAAAKGFLGVGLDQARRTGLRQIISDEEFSEMLEKDKKSKFLIRQLAGQLLKMQLMKIENNGRNLGAILLLEKVAANEGSDTLSSILPFSNLHTFHDVICQSPAMKKAVSDAKLYGNRIGTPLVITGEYGTGKELMAQSIHSFYHEDDYIGMNCATLPDSEAVELFCGVADKEHKPGLATVGTLTLENIWEASEKLQACLLWALEGKCGSLFTGRGGAPTQFGIITIIPSDKWELCTKTVRTDLLHRLQTLILKLPPLRERTEDLFPLFLRYAGSRSEDGRIFAGKGHELLPILTGYSWPGNVNELYNVCSRYALHAATERKLTATGEKRLLIDCIGEQQLFDDVVAHLGVPREVEQMSGEELRRFTERLKEILLYNNDQIAEKLGVSRTGMWRKMRQTED